MTQITGEETADFIVPRTPETVTFQPFDSTESMYNVGKLVQLCAFPYIQTQLKE